LGGEVAEIGRRPDGDRPRRRRGTGLEQAILGAAVEELTDVGYAGLTMDRVAKRAGTNKNTIYRRWPNRAALAVAAYRQLVAGDSPLPDTGELRGDALALLRRINRETSSPTGAIQRSLVSSIDDDPDLRARLLEQAADGATGPWRAILDRARARGEAGLAALNPRVATLPIVLLRNEYLTRGICPVPDSVLVEIVDEVYLPLVRQRSGPSPS
jgi:AcrR family transcriptional regulator